MQRAQLLQPPPVIAFGAVIKETSGYQAMINYVMNLHGNPLMVLGLTSTLISGITGSGSGGISFTMEIFTDHFLSIGVNPQMFHRIVTMAASDWTASRTMGLWSRP